MAFLLHKTWPLLKEAMAPRTVPPPKAEGKAKKKTKNNTTPWKSEEVTVIVSQKAQCSFEIRLDTKAMWAHRL